jgi:hypothetical protein
LFDQNRYPERFAQQALGHNSKAVHRAYAKHAEVTVPSLDDWEKEREARPKARMENGGLKTEGGLQKLVAVDFRGPVVAVAEAN